MSENSPEATGSPNELVDPVRVDVGSHPSRCRGRHIFYRSYLPRTPMTRPPGLLVLLHGAWDSWNAWFDHADDLLRCLSVRHNLVIVTPDGEPFGWYLDSPILSSSQLETYLLEELIPYCEDRLGTDPCRKSISGLSMGGHGALGLALKHPGLFQSASSMSGILDIRRHPDSWQIPDVLGPYQGTNRSVWAAHSVHALVECAGGLPVPTLFTCGIDDEASLMDNRRLHQLLESLGSHHTYREGPGDHDWSYWRDQLPHHIAFHARHLNGGS